MEHDKVRERHGDQHRKGGGGGWRPRKAPKLMTLLAGHGLIDAFQRRERRSKKGMNRSEDLGRGS